MPLLTCPNDGGGMQEVNRNGVLLDMCPTCRGVWLDRGELEKLLSYMQEDDRGYEAKRDGDKQHERYQTDRYDDDDYRDKSYKGKKKRSLFDFFD
ncbi:MAG: zf-TFIIB domain-containing protein [Trueperaceae bacterium]